jgi:tetratricopeptide (TPR) repeat protein
MTEVNRAHKLDPLSPAISAMVGELHITAQQYDEAIAACKKLADENPTFARAHRCLAYGYWRNRMYPQVIEEWKAYGQLSGDRNESEFASALERGFHAAGWKGALTNGIETRKTQRKTVYSPAYEIAALYADLGDKEQAFRWLDNAYQEREWQMTSLKTDFLLDPLRSDSRFNQLVRKMGLPE